MLVRSPVAAAAVTSWTISGPFESRSRKSISRSAFAVRGDSSFSSSSCHESAGRASSPSAISRVPVARKGPHVGTA